LHVEPYTPAARLAQGKRDAAFRPKPHIALELVEKARAADIAFEAIVADCGYGENDELEMALRDRELPYVLARRSSATGGWALTDFAFTFKEAAQNVPKGAWQAGQRRFRDGHVEIWWAADLTSAGYGPGKHRRAVCATTDPSTLPEIST
jgi:SRSO17 transposase